MKPTLTGKEYSAAIHLFKPKVLIPKIFDLKLGAAITFTLFLFSIQSYGQALNGTYTVPGSYATLASAVTALNTNGISGTVTINIAAGFTETAPAGGYTLTATGTSTNKIIFQKNGAGADPLLTAPTGGTATATTNVAQLDGIFRLIGSDYVTINGIDLKENASNTTNATMMEFGYGFFKQSATNGCQNNTIENCTITLSKTNFTTTAPGVVAPGSTGILLDNATNTVPNTALAVTSVAGANSNNVFIANTITNVFTGIFIVGYNSATPYTYYDQNNTVGRSGKGNTITDFGSGASALTTYGIYGIYQNSDSICYNTINNMTGGGAAHTNVLYGIYQNTSTNSTAVVNNNSVTLEQGNNAFAFYCIDLNVAGIGSVTIDNNTIGASNSGAATAAFYGIYNQGLSNTVTFSNNNFNNSTVNTNTNAYLIYNLGGGSAGITCTLNHITTGFTKSTAGGTVCGYYSTSATVTSGTEVISQNNFSNISVTGATLLYGIYTSTADAQTKNINTDTITGCTGGSSNAMAIYMDHLGSGSTIYSNYINNNTGTGSVYGINSFTASATETTVSIYSNTISNLVSSAVSGTVYGIYQQNTKATTVNIYSNIITKLSPTGTTSPVVYCINMVGGPAYNIYSNSINTISASSAGTKPLLYGIFSNGATVSNQTKIYDNTIYGFSETGTTGSLYAIDLTAGSTTAIIDSNKSYSFTESGTGASNVFGVYLSGANTTVTIDSNIITGLTSSSPSGNIYGIDQATATTTSANIYSNTITNLSSTGATSPAIYCLDIVGGPAYTIDRNSINTISATSAGTKPYIYAIYSSGATLSNLSKIYDNTIYSLNETGATGALYALDLTAASTTINIDSNAIYKFNATGTGGTIFPVYLSGANVMVNIDSNFINNLVSSAASETIYGIYQTTTTTTTVNIYTNTISDLTPTSATSPSIYCIRFVGGPAYNIYSNSINTISTTSAATSPSVYGIYSSGAGTGNTNIYSNTINGLSATGTGATLDGFYLTNGSTTQNIYSNSITNLTSSTASGTIYGVYLNIATNTTENIYSNTISSLSSTGLTSPLIYPIRTVAGPNYNIYSNSINTISAGSAGTSPVLYGIYSGGSTGSNITTIYDNSIYNYNATGTGATVTAEYISAGTTTAVYNNFISNLTTPASNTSNAIIGIYAIGGTTDEVYYNTIYLNATSTGTAFGSSCVSFKSTVLLDLRDNILSNNSTPTGIGCTVALLRTTSTAAGVAPLTTNYASTSNNNAFYVSVIVGNYYAYADKATAPVNTYTKGCGDLASYQSFIGSGRDANSVFELPPFINISTTPYNLNLSTTTATECESGGANIAGYTTDYNGNIREGNTGYSGTGTAPDIGADEFNGTANSDVSPPTVNFMSIPNMACTGAPSLSVTITDGNGIASGGDAPRLYYKKASDATNTIATVNNNTVNGWKYVTASSISGSTYTFKPNYGLFSVAPTIGDSIRYFIVVQDSSPAKNIFQDASTFTPCPTTINAISSANTITMNPGQQVYQIRNTMSGTYTIGAVGGGVVTYPTAGFNNFASLTLVNGLFDAVNHCLLTGNVTVTVNANLTLETGAVVLNEWQEYNTGTCAQLTPSFTLTIKPASATQYIISGTPAASTALVTLNGPARVIFDGSYGGSGNYLRFLCSNTADNTFELTNDDSTITLKYLQIEQAGTGSDIDIDQTIGNSGNYNINIDHCIIRDQSTGAPASVPAYGIWVGGTNTIINTYISITNNQISNFSNSGISINSAVNGNNMVIKNNYIFYNSTITAIPTTQQYGINFVPGTGANDTISNNIIGGSSSIGSGMWTNSFNGSNYGMYVQGGSSNTVISNNLVKDITASSAGTSNQLFGIYLFDGLANINNNTISNLSSASTIAANIDNAANTNYQNAAITGIESNSTYTGNLITNNSINTLSATTAGVTLTFIAGIGADNIGGTVQQNQVYGLTNTATGPGGIAGIRTTAGTEWKLINNMISLTNGANANPVRIVGIDNGTSLSSYFYFNSVFIGGGASSGTGTSAAWDCIATGATDSLYNNILFNVRSNTASASGNNYAISQTNVPATFISNYNNLYSAKNTTLGNLGGALTFANWKTNTSGDAQSVSDSVLFYSPVTGNLNVDTTSNCYIHHSGISISGITNDYNNNTRNSIPDIGADEFNMDQITLAILSPNPACVGNAVSLVPTTNVTSATTYKWIGPSSYNSTQQNPSISSVTTANAGLFSDTITDKIGCKSFSTSTLSISLPAVITAQPSDVSTCSFNTSTITIAATGATSYQWQVSTDNGDTWNNINNSGIYSNVTTSTLSISYPILNMNGYQYLCVLGSTAPCALNSNAAILNVINTTDGNWIGVTSSDWNTATNWCGGIPTSSTDVVIPSGTTYSPVMNGTCWCHNLTINNGASVTFNSGSDLIVSGTITNNGTVTNTVGTITLSGSSPQTFPISSTYNLSISNSTGITLSSDLTVTNNLTLTNGIITTGTNHLIVTNTVGTSISSQSSSSYINGNLRRYVANGNNYDFPVGTSGNYELASLNLTSSSGITYIDGYFTPGTTTLPNPSLCYILGTRIVDMLNGGFWTITPNNYTGVKYDLTLNETGYTNIPSSANIIGLIKRHNSASTWLGTDSSDVYSVYGNHNSSNSSLNGTTLAVVKRTNIHDFSDDGIGSSDDGTALPIELVSFNAAAVDNKTVHITWVTASQLNNKSFIVERSADGINFDSIGQQDGCGTCVDLLTYAMDDNSPIQGTGYYRLKQVDNAGAITNSAAVAVTIDATGIESVNIYPNPTAGQSTLEITSAVSKDMTIVLTDVLGRNILSINANLNKGINTISLPTNSLAKGIYFIEMMDNNGQDNFKLKLIKT